MDIQQSDTDFPYNDEAQLAIKRKWQIALRRYLLENNPAITYAPYFRLTSTEMKKWIEVQFHGEMNWDNFGKVWNLTQRVPAHLFNLLNEQDLSLCWHFINQTVQRVGENQITSTISLLGSKYFYTKLYESTQFPKCSEMILKITALEKSHSETLKASETFILENRAMINQFNELDGEDFLRLNKGTDLQSILLEKELIKKYGS